MKDELKKLVEHAEKRAEQAWQWGHTWHNADAATVRDLCVAVRDIDAENEKMRALLSDLIAVDERGALGNLATREQAFVELGDIVVAARELLGAPTAP